MERKKNAHLSRRRQVRESNPVKEKYWKYDFPSPPPFYFLSEAGQKVTNPLHELLPSPAVFSWFLSAISSLGHKQITRDIKKQQESNCLKASLQSWLQNKHKSESKLILTSFFFFGFSIYYLELVSRESTTKINWHYFTLLCQKWENLCFYSCYVKTNVIISTLERNVLLYDWKCTLMRLYCILEFWIPVGRK